jgi:23S rRNA-/tRNA-specific pseudouridylate synthase
MLPNFDEWLIHPFPSDKNTNQSAEMDSAAELSKSSLHLLERQESLSERELRNLHKKIAAEARASMPLNPYDHLRPIYIDESIVVVDKPGGVLCVPGIRRNPSVANIVHTYIGGTPGEDVDKMVVHRLDGATSGVVVFARTLQALQKLHLDFRDRNVKKTYEALLCGHLHSQEGEIDLPLERDRNRPPFMRVATSSVSHPDGDDGGNDSFREDDSSPNLHKHDGYKKMMSKKPKESFSTFRVISYEYLEGCPVTRVELVPFTGRCVCLYFQPASFL